MTSEVVTNAVTHGSPESDGGIGLRLERAQEAVRVVVTDGGDGFALDPGSIEDANRDEHFGLFLVDRFADRWGLASEGKTAIWIEIDTPTSV